MASSWESIKSSVPKIKLMRMKTPMGWLVRTTDGESIIHIKDPALGWVENSILNWEPILKSGKDAQLKRAKVPGGWILFNTQETKKRSYEGDSFKMNSSSLIFVEDVMGEWI